MPLQRQTTTLYRMIFVRGQYACVSCFVLLRMQRTESANGHLLTPLAVRQLALASHLVVTLRLRFSACTCSSVIVASSENCCDGVGEDFFFFFLRFYIQ